MNVEGSRPPVADIQHPLGKARIEAKVSRLALSRELRVAYTTLWRWETGRHSPPAFAVTVWQEALARLAGLHRGGRRRKVAPV